MKKSIRSTRPLLLGAVLLGAAMPALASYTKTVAATSNATTNGNNLVAALSGLSPTPTCKNPWVIKLDPGVYNLGTATLAMRKCVDIQGSGQGVTVIRSASTGAAVNLADSAELRFLTVQSTKATAVSGVNRKFARLTHVQVRAGGSNVYNVGVKLTGTQARLTEVNIAVSGGEDAVGLENGQGSNVVLDRVEVEAKSALYLTGIMNYGNLDLRGSSVRVENVTGQFGDGSAQAVAHYSGKLSIRGGSLITSGAFHIAHGQGIWAESTAGLEIANVRIQANSFGIFNGIGSPLRLSGSRIEGSVGVVNYGSLLARSSAVSDFNMMDGTAVCRDVYGLGLNPIGVGCQ